MKRWIKSAIGGICIACVCSSGCAIYKPEPPDLRKEAVAWREISLLVAPAGRTTARSRTELGAVGLALNADLNKARLKALSSKHTARYAALWDDPNLSMSADRVIPGVTYDRAVSLGLSIPISGRTELARRAAELYAEADVRELRAQELDFLTRLHALCYVIQVTHTKHSLMQQRAEEVREELRSITTLHSMGEATAADLQEATRRGSDLLKELQELENTHLSKHLELLNLLGLHPAIGNLEVAGALPIGVPTLLPPPTEAALLAHPRMQAAMSAYRTTEAELRLEIRKQYPDLTLTPGYSYEEEDDRIGLELGLSLPLWNRNREAIARSSGARAQSSLNAVAQYRELVQQAHALTRRQALAHKHCAAEYQRLTALQAAMEQQERLFSIGEVTLPALTAARHETYTRRLAYLDCLAELLEIQVALHSLSVPDIASTPLQPS